MATAAATATALVLLAPAAAARTPCDDLLVTHRPSGPLGDAAAVRVTSQTFERGTEGWAAVGWDVAPGIELRTVVLEGAAGVTELPATDRSATGAIDALHFCGTDSAGQPAADGAATRPGDPTQVVTADVGGGSAVGPGLLGGAIGAAIGAAALARSRGGRRGAEVLG